MNASKQNKSLRTRKSRLGRGQGLAEYALIIALVGIVSILVMALTGTSIRNAYCKVTEGLGMRACVFIPTEWNKIRGSWDIADKICGGVPNVGEGRLFADGFSGNDYTINIDSAMLSQGNGYGVFFRATNESNVNGYSFQYDPGYGSGAFLIRKWVNGSELSKPIAVQYAPSGYNWLNSPRNVQVVVKGNQFTAYVDNVPVLNATDNTYSSGGIGLRTWDNTKMCVSGVSVKEQ